MRNAEQPAFPKVTPVGDQLQNGLTKREYFAGLAMRGILSSYETQKDMQDDPRYNGQNFSEVVAKNSIEFADALLTELSK